MRIRARYFIVDHGAHDWVLRCHCELICVCNRVRRAATLDEVLQLLDSSVGRRDERLLLADSLAIVQARVVRHHEAECVRGIIIDSISDLHEDSMARSLGTRVPRRRQRNLDQPIGVQLGQCVLQR